MEHSPAFYFIRLLDTGYSLKESSIDKSEMLYFWINSEVS